MGKGREKGGGAGKKEKEGNFLPFYFSCSRFLNSADPTIWEPETVVKCVKKNFNTTNKFCQTLGPTLNRGSTVPAFITFHEGVWTGKVEL